MTDTKKAAGDGTPQAASKTCCDCHFTPINPSLVKRRPSWWTIGKRPTLTPVAKAELEKIKAILAGGRNG